MKPQELRIGNYYLSYGVDLKQVERLTKDKILIDFHPVPLTEQWLKDFGFVKRNNVAWDYKEKLSNTFFPILTINVFSFDMITDDKYGTILKYVHSLQNLYFALTGKELTK